MPRAVFSADFAPFDRDLRAVQARVEQFGQTTGNTAKAVNRLVSEFSGQKVISQANAMVAAVEKIGGATQLTTAEQAKLNQQLTVALDKYQVLGAQAPASMQKLHAETAGAAQQLEQLKIKSSDAAQKTSLMGAAATQVKAAFAGMIGAFTIERVISGLVTAIGKTVEFAGTITDLSAKTGISTDALQKFNYAAQQNGNTLEQVTGAVSQMSKRLAEGEDSTVGALEKLGLSFEQIRGMAPDQAFIAIATAIAGVKDPMEQTRLAMELFGRSGAEILPTIKADLAALGDEAAAAGAIIDKETVAAMDNLGDAIGKTTLAGQGFIARVLEPAIPLLESFANGLAAAAQDFPRLYAAFLAGGPALASLEAGMMKQIPVTGDAKASLDRYNKSLTEVRSGMPSFAEAQRLLREETAKTSAGWKQGASDAKAYQATLDKLSGRAAVDAAREQVKQITAIGGAYKVLKSEAEGAAKIVNAGIEAMVQRGEKVPPVYHKIATELGIVTMQWPELVDWTNKYAASIGALSHTDWSKIVPPKDLFPKVVEGLPKVGQLVGTSHPDWSKIVPPETKATLFQNMFGTKQQFGSMMTSTILGAFQGGGNVGKSIGGALGGTIAGGIGKSITTAMTGLSGALPAIMGALGTAIPVLGTIAGGLLGNVLGGLFGPSQKKLTQQAREKWIAEQGGLENVEAAAKRANVSLTALMSATKEKTLQTEIDKLSAALTKADARIKKTTDSLTKLSTAGGLVSKDLVEALKLDADQADIQQSVVEFFGAQTSRAAAGLGAYVENVSVKTAAGANAIAASLSAVFTSMQQQGMTAAQALGVLEPTIARFSTRLTEMGLTAPAAFGQLQQLAWIAGDAMSGPLLEGVTGVGQALEGLFNTGLLTQDMFYGLTVEIGATYKELEAQGKGGEDAILLMQKPLQTVWELQQKFGFETDENTQGILDFAEGAGLIGEKFMPAQERIASGIEQLVVKLDQFLAAFTTGVTTTAQAAASTLQSTLGNVRIPEIKVPVSVSYSDEYRRVTSGGGINVDVSPARADVDSSISVTTVLDGQVIAQNQMPHLARELTLMGV